MKRKLCKKIRKYINRWQSGNVLGTGSFGRVVYGLNKNTGQVMAVKQVHLSDAKNSSMMQKVKALELEIEILKQLNHKNIVRYIGTSQDEEYLNIFLEYVAGNISDNEFY